MAEAERRLSCNVSLETRPSTLLAELVGSWKAEGVGFEPTVGLHLLRFSRPSQSTTLAPLRSKQKASVETFDHRLTRRTVY